MKPIRFKIISLFPDLLAGYLQDAMIAKAIGLNLLSVEIVNLRNFSDNAYKSVDDSPYGGGDGMLIRADILERALLSVHKDEFKQWVIYLSPQGSLLNSKRVQQFTDGEFDEVILICGRYAGIDERFIESYVDEEISIGDYVLSGGELPALVVVESVSRFIPGVLGKIESAQEDSFKENLLEAPQYTRPSEWNGLKVPEVLVSGDHKKIADWRKQMAVQVTERKRPDLVKKNET
jgi:tRNA (guanine37-N1)-methyltransferase